MMHHGGGQPPATEIPLTLAGTVKVGARASDAEYATPIRHM
jgi:hypothetical protein